LYIRGVKKDKTHSEGTGCSCKPIDINEITSAVDEVIEHTGREKDKVILILQEVQKKLNYIPSEALKHICSVTDITPGQLSGVSTFYSQFRHLPVGKHIIKVCSGTACHVKGSQLISEAFQRELKIDDVVAERLMGHKLQGMLAVYNQYDYLPEKRQALGDRMLTKEKVQLELLIFQQG